MRPVKCFLYLITKCMASNDNGSSPTRDKAWNVVQDNRFTKDGAIQNVTKSTVRWFPHLLELEFYRESCVSSLPYFHSLLLPSTRASSGVMVAHLIPTLYFLIASAASTVTWSLVYSIKQGLSAGLFLVHQGTYSITVLNRQIIVLDVKLQVRENELFLDELPNDASHFIAVQVNDRVLHNNLASHGSNSSNNSNKKKGFYNMSEEKEKKEEGTEEKRKKAGYI